MISELGAALANLKVARADAEGEVTLSAEEWRWVRETLREIGRLQLEVLKAVST